MYHLFKWESSCRKLWQMAKTSSTVGKNQCHSKGVPLCTLDRIKSEHIHLNKSQILKCRNHRNPYWFNSCVKMFPPSVSRSRSRSQWGTIRWFPTTWRGKTLSGGDKVVNTIRSVREAWFWQILFHEDVSTFPLCSYLTGQAIWQPAPSSLHSSDPLVIHTTNKFNTKCLLKKTFKMVDI